MAAVRLLDYQAVQSGSPLPDLHYFLGSSVTPEVLSKREEILREVYYPELFRVLGLLGSPLTAEDYPFDAFYDDFLGNSEFCLLSALLILPIVMAKGDEVPDYDTGDLRIEDFKEMAKDMVDKSQSAGAVLKRFAHVVQIMADTGVI